jgi:hypothetical protein
MELLEGFNSSDRNVTPPIGMNADAEGLRFQRGALFPPLEWLARHRPIQIALVIGCALLFLVPTSLSNDSVVGRSHSKTLGSLSPNNSPISTYAPFVLNATQLPYPDFFNSSPNITLPQVTSAYQGVSSIFELAYVTRDAHSNTNVSFVLGQYNASLAESAQRNIQCPTCAVHLPFRWSSPIVVYQAGHTTVQADAIASLGSNVAVAFTLSNQTFVVVSNSYGANASWYVATPSAIGGGSPRLALASCVAYLTTITPAHLVATTIPLSCPMPVGPTPPPTPPPPEPGGQPPPPPTGESLGTGVGWVWGVFPDQSPLGSTVTIYGNNVTQATQVTIGGIPVSIQGVSFATSTITVTVPSSGLPVGLPSPVIFCTKLGCTNPNPSGWLTVGIAPPPTVPQVTGVYPSWGMGNTAVQIVGTNFPTTSTSVKFGTVAVTGTYVNSRLEDAAAPTQAQYTIANVTVQGSGGWSLTNSPADLFTYNTQRPMAPQQSSIHPDYGLAGTNVTVYGSNFVNVPGFRVVFGSTASSTVNIVSSSQLTAIAPKGSGLVHVLVGSRLGTAYPVLGDLFNYVASAPPGPTSENLPPAVAAQPLVRTLPNGTQALGILASNSSNHEILWYNLTSSAHPSSSTSQPSTPPSVPRSSTPSEAPGSSQRKDWRAR